MDLLKATNGLVETIKKLTLWNEKSDNSHLQDYENVNSAIQNGNKDAANKILHEMRSDNTSDYLILNTAISFGYVDVANFMLEKDCEVNVISFVPSLTPLHNAIKLGDIQLVKKLLEKGASVLEVESVLHRDSPLHVAYKDAFTSKDYQLVDLLLVHIEETSSYINVKNQYGLSHFHIAAARGKAQLVQKFINAGASLLDYVYDDSPTHAGYTALEFACDKKCLDTIKVCRQELPDRVQISVFANEHVRQKFVVVSEIVNQIENPYQYIIKLHHKFGEDCDHLSNFHLACFTGDLDSVQQLLDKGADVDVATSQNAEFTPLYTALHFALESEKQRFEKVKLLLKCDADVYYRNGFCMTALHLAMYTHNCEELESEGSLPTILLLYPLVEDKEANPMDSNGLTYFHIAVAINDIHLVKKMLDSGVDPNQSILENIRDFSNYTPLHFAAKYDCKESAKLLIDHGAEINCGKDETPLQLSLQFGCYEMIDLLLENNADVKVMMTSKLMTTLHLLVDYYVENSCSTENALQEKEKLIGFVEKLVNLGVDVNAKDQNGFTVLHNACWNMYNGIWLIERLLTVGADINLKNNHGETPLDVARRCASKGTYEDFLLLYHHVQRLQALGLEVDANNEEFCKMLMEKKDDWKNNDDWKIVEEMYSDETLARKEKERIDEIEKLKEDMIAEGVSLYDYLKMDAEQAAIYVENKSIEKIIDDENDADYEVYGYLIFVQYRKSLDWFTTRLSEESED